MKLFLTISILLASNISILAQGINFEKGKWQEVINKAKVENKSIYLDVFTTWCGPCAVMAKKYFPDSTIGEMYNKHFINYSIDAEKDEGILLAKKYKVDGFPTNLFIDPNTQKAFYITAGCPSEKEGFIQNATIALQEKLDSLSYDDYLFKIKTGKYDEVFLKTFLEKNNKLHKGNDAYLDIYFTKYAKQQTMFEKLKFMSDNEMSAFANSFNIIKDLQVPDSIGYQKRSIIYRALTIAERAGNENKIIAATNIMMKYYPDGVFHRFVPLDKFYTDKKNYAKLLKLYTEYGTFFTNIKQETIDAQNLENITSIKKQIKWQAQNGMIKTNNVDSFVEAHVTERTELRYLYNTRIGDNLNSICWNIFENPKAYKTLQSQSLIWITKAMQLVNEVPENWCMYADTYAHLLVLNNSKAKAIEVQKEVLQKAEENKIKSIDLYKKYLLEISKF